MLGGIAIILVLLTLGVMQWRQRESQNAKQQTSLGLQVQVEKNFFRASWNPRSRALEGAKSGTLQVGSESFDLSADKLKRGFIQLPFKDRLKRDLNVRLIAGTAEENSNIILSPH